MPYLEKVDGSRNNLHSFVLDIYIKLAGNASCLPNYQHQVLSTIGQLVGEAFAKVEAYMTNESIN
jgi:hypothetical protein